MVATNSAFISYRREPGFAWAQLIWEGLRTRGIDAFLDLENLHEPGQFKDKILNQIAGRPYFIIVLTTGTLDRCKEPGDWLWRELEHAIAEHRVVVPAIIKPFDIADASQFLPSMEAADILRESSGVDFHPAYLDAAVERLINILQETEHSIRPLTDEDREFARRAVERTEQAQPEPAPEPVQPEPSPEPVQPPRRRERVVAATVAVVALVALIAVLAVRPWNGSDASPPTGSSTTPTIDDRLTGGEALAAGERIQTPDGRHVLEMTTGGRLVARTDGVEFWGAPRVSDAVAGSVAHMQGDGNLVVYRSPTDLTGANAVFASRTDGHSGAVLVIGDEGGRGFVAIHDTDGNELFRRPRDDSGPATAPETSPPATTTETTETFTGTSTTTALFETTVPG